MFYFKKFFDFECNFVLIIESLNFKLIFKKSQRLQKSHFEHSWSLLSTIVRFKSSTYPSPAWSYQIKCPSKASKIFAKCSSFFKVNFWQIFVWEFVCSREVVTLDRGAGRCGCRFIVVSTFHFWLEINCLFIRRPSPVACCSLRLL